MFDEQMRFCAVKSTTKDEKQKSGNLKVKLSEIDLSSILLFDIEVTEKFENYLIDFYSLLEIGFQQFDPRVQQI